MQYLGFVNMYKYCHKCGAELIQGTKFCSQCGEPIMQFEAADQSNQQSTSTPPQTNTLDTQYVQKPKKGYTDLFLSGTIDSVKQATQSVFSQNKFDVKWESAFAGKATKGSKAANVALGAFAQYYQIDFQVFSMPNKDIALRLIHADAGGWGSVAGIAMSSNKYKKTINMMVNQFQVMGIYKGRHP